MVECLPGTHETLSSVLSCAESTQREKHYSMQMSKHTWGFNISEIREGKTFVVTLVCVPAHAMAGLLESGLSRWVPGIELRVSDLAASTVAH